MSRIFAGELSRIDDDVLEALKGLPDDYWVLAEFNVGRNMDWVVIRPQDGAPAVLIATELKRLSRPVTGQTDGQWRIAADGDDAPIQPSNPEDINYYWQSVNSANAFKRWLWNSQPLFRDSSEILPEEDFRVWPDLLILSPEGVQHRLPLAPSSKYGRWFTNMDQWVAHLLSWRPKHGTQFRESEVAHLVEALSLKQIWGPPAPTVFAPRPAEALAPIDGAVAPPDGSPERDPGAGEADLLARVARLEQQVAALETALRSRPPSPREGYERVPAPVMPSADREWSPEEERALRESIAAVRLSRKSRALPTILDYMSRELGYSLAQSRYNGFGTARAMFDRALADGIVKYGPSRGPNPTIYLPDEEIEPV